MAMIDLTDAGFRYPDSGKWVFRHLYLSISAGEAVRVVGRNGAGKSTLLKVLSGQLELTEGRYFKQQAAKLAYMDQFSGEMLARDLTIEEQLEASVTPRFSTKAASVGLLSQFGLDLQNRLQAFIGHL